MSVQARVSWLPIDAWYRGFIEHEEGGHAGTDRDREIGRGDLFQIEFDHHILGDLPAFGGTILQPLEPILHLGDAALEPRRQGFVGQCRADDNGDDLMQVGEALNCVGEGLLIDLGDLLPGFGRGLSGRRWQKIRDSWQTLQKYESVIALIDTVSIDRDRPLCQY